MPETLREFGPLAIGDRFADRYEVLRPLGRGGMGAVYAAHDAVLGEAVALKILSTRAEVDEAAIRRFHHEVRLARRVTHANVVRVHDIGEADGFLYMTMALIDGETLRTLMREQGPLALPRSLALFTELVSAVAAVHAEGIIHRDLKPTNILLDRRGRLLLADFGIARSSEHPELTRPGALVGTLRYMAPEQLRLGDNVDARTDVYALGLLLHELLTGEVPAIGCGLQSDLRGLVRGGDPALLPRIERLLERCLSPNPAARPASAAALFAELQGLRASPTAIDPSDATGEDTATALSSPPTFIGEATTAAPPRPATVLPPTAAELRDLAVLPFHYFGPPADAYLAQTIAEELVDLLARLRGIKVLGTGATSAFAATRDPRAIGESLGVLWVIDGTIQRAGDRAKTAVRMLDATTGEQLWSESVTGTISDIFTFQTSVARVVAEHVRTELTTLTSRTQAPPEAIELYLAARRDLSNFDLQERGHAAYGALHEALRIAPDLAPARAALAYTAVRSWFTGSLPPAGCESWELEAEALVREALARAPDLPETHLAAAIFALQRCDFPAAVGELAETLRIAPTHAEGHRYLAMLEAEAGLGASAIARFRLVADIDRADGFALTQIARWQALAGDVAAADALFDEAARRTTTPSLGVCLMRLRDALWRGSPTIPLSPAERSRIAASTWALPRLFVAATGGTLTAEALAAAEPEIRAMGQSPRGTASSLQFLTELWATLGDPDQAILRLVEAASIGLMDTAWLDRCPLLSGLRGLPAFEGVSQRVRARALAAFAVAPSIHTTIT